MSVTKFKLRRKSLKDWTVLPAMYCKILVIKVKMSTNVPSHPKIKKEYQEQTSKTNIYAYEYRIKYFKILTYIFMYVRIINPCNKDETKSIQ